MLDRLITGGSVVDGTGAPARIADIGIKDGRIVAVGRLREAAREVIDADGLLVAPGFVDIHTHYDGQATWDPLLAPSFHHGVTTVAMGNCGVGFAPAAPDRRQWLIGLMEGVEDIPGTALAEGIDWAWESFPEYLDALERKPRAIDVCAQIAHGAVRAYVMGERGARNEPASADEIARMAALTAEALAAGAVGFSTSRTILHRAIDGEPVPGTFAAEDELSAIARAVASCGHGVFEVAPAGIAGEDVAAPEREVSWMVRISAETGCPITFLMGQTNTEPKAWREMIDRVAEARAKGAKVTPQVFGRATGILASLRSAVHAFARTPSYLSLADLPHEERVRRLQLDRGLFERVATEPSPLDTEYGGIFAYPWRQMYRLGTPPNYEPDPSESIHAIAERTGRNPREVALEAMLEEGGEAVLIYNLLGYADGDLEPVREMILDPSTILGGSDGGAHSGVICDASVPTFLITHWARDRKRGARLPVELLIRKQTRDTARLFGLHDRGILAEGYRADLNLIDFATLAIGKPHFVHDLPAGAPRLMQKAEGYVATLVAGEVIQRNGEHTGALPGKLVRGGRVAAA